MLEKYLQILTDGLVKKLDVLTQIEKKSIEQSELIADDASFEDIDANMNEKDKLIDELLKLDEGFDAMYERIKPELLANKDQYASQIRVIQNYISEVMSKSASIEAVESRNKAQMTLKFTTARKGLTHQKSASTAAYDYYKVASKLNAVTPQFLDKKK